MHMEMSQLPVEIHINTEKCNTNKNNQNIIQNQLSDCKCASDELILINFPCNNQP